MAESVPTRREHSRGDSHRRIESERGPFAINENPSINPSYAPESLDPDKAADAFDYAELAAEYGEAPVREKIGEMMQALGHGNSVTPLFWQGGENGMSLVHAWFGPNFPLFRHSHPAHGDCLYYVVAGEAILGRRRLKAGSTFFIPNGMPYKYRAGPAGVEVLEFRAGGGEPGAPGMQLHETSLDAIQRIIDTADENRPSWQAPSRIGETALRQAELDSHDAE
jgi:hypothetical protein